MVTDVTDATPAVTETPAPVTIPPVEPPPAVSKPVMATPKVSVSPSITMLVDQLNGYMTAMDPTKQLSEVIGVQQQVGLWRTISWLFKRPPEEFPELWAMFLRIVFENSKDRGVFSQSCVFRCFPNLVGKLSDTERTNFTRLMTMVLRTADPTTRANVRRFIDINSVVNGFTDPGVSQRLVDFYRL